MILDTMAPDITNRDPKSGTEEVLDATTPITYRYLTFQTPLPIPDTSSLSQPPDPPDLSRYSDPITWPNSRKNIMLGLSCFATFLTAYTAGSYSPPHELIREDLGGTSSVAVLSGITTFCLGFAIAPMALAPFSEMSGRYPVFVAAGIIYVIFQAVCGVVRTVAGMVIARLLVGIGASVFSTMVGGVIADLWGKQDRNTPMAIFSGVVLAGTGAGPLFAAIMTKRLASGKAWKWVFWHQVITSGVCILSFVFFFRESRGSVLLSRRARALNSWYESLESQGCYGVWLSDNDDDSSSQDSSTEPSSDEEKTPTTTTLQTHASPKRIRWLVKEDEERSSLFKIISISISRPFHLLFTESIVFFFSLWVSFAWGVLYLDFGSIPLVFRRQYGWDIEQAGLIFLTLIIGAVISTFSSIWQERILHHPGWDPSLPAHANLNLPHGKTWAFLRRNFPSDSPEARLYISCVTSILLPIGLFLFGLTARPHIHWLVPATGLVLATMGILSIYLAIFNYFADSYQQYASSALAAQSMCRNIVGGAFPLVTRPLVENLGEVRFAVLLGGIAVGLTIVPWVLVFCGDRIRARSPFASVSHLFLLSVSRCLCGT